MFPLFLFPPLQIFHILLLVIHDGGRGEWKVVTGGGQAELSQDGGTPSFITSPVFF